jgi:hypothetical protein
VAPCLKKPENKSVMGWLGRALAGRLKSKAARRGALSFRGFIPPHKRRNSTSDRFSMPLGPAVSAQHAEIFFDAITASKLLSSLNYYEHRQLRFEVFTIERP